MEPGRWSCDQGRVLVALLGVGKSAARNRLNELLATGSRPARIVVAGFAGGLRRGLAVGDVLMAAEVIDEVGGKWKMDCPSDRSGRVLTCEKMISEPLRKRELNAEHQADVVDMESSAVAEICRQAGISFGCIRVISDDVDTRLSQCLMALVESGRVTVWRVIKLLLRSPRLIFELIRLARHTRSAGESLAKRLKSELG
jgi:adenosylhomocysteine nucleosidase